MEPQRPLPLILARNLITSIGTPAFLVDRDGNLLFYNEAAGAMLGVSFEEVGQMDAEAWTTTFGPLDESGAPMPLEEMPLTIALRDGRPAHTRHRIRSTRGGEHTIEASAFPIIGTDSGSSGALIIFWPLGSAGVAAAVGEQGPGDGEDSG
jgi:PAS domain-containing protein